MVSPRKTPAQPIPAEDVSASVIEPAEDVSLPARDPALALQRMEAALVRADLVHPNVLTPEEFRRLRYLISFARLDVFEPGAAGPGGVRGRGGVSVGAELAGFRGRVIDALHDALRKEHDLERRLIGAKEALIGVADLVDEQRKNLAELRRRHGLPGLFLLRFDTIADGLFRGADGERMRMQDLAIPCCTTSPTIPPCIRCSTR